MYAVNPTGNLVVSPWFTGSKEKKDALGRGMVE